MYLYISEDYALEVEFSNGFTQGFKSKYWCINILPELYVTLDKQSKYYEEFDSYHGIAIGFNWLFFGVLLEFSWRLKQ